MNSSQKRKIAIIGYGRFGKLWARILQNEGEIFVMDNKDIREENVSRIDHFDLGGMDWVIFAVPISQMERAVRESAGFLSAGTLVMDVCSVKVHPMQVLKNNLDERVEILGTHPMFGPDSAGYGLKGLQMVLCPERISPETLRIVKDVFSGLGLSLLEKTPQEHDRQTAKSLALVHYLGRALHDMDLKGLELTTLGMERLLAIDETVSNDTWELFLDMHVYNPYTGEVRRELRERLQNLEHKINNKINNKEEL